LEVRYTGLKKLVFTQRKRLPKAKQALRKRLINNKLHIKQLTKQGDLVAIRADLTAC
jgi:hypothetical protein